MEDDVHDVHVNATHAGDNVHDVDNVDDVYDGDDVGDKVENVGVDNIDINYDHARENDKKKIAKIITSNFVKCRLDFTGAFGNNECLRSRFRTRNCQKITRANFLAMVNFMPRLRQTHPRW